MKKGLLGLIIIGFGTVCALLMVGCSGDNTLTPPRIETFLVFDFQRSESTNWTFEQHVEFFEYRDTTTKALNFPNEHGYFHTIEIFRRTINFNTQRVAHSSSSVRLRTQHTDNVLISSQFSGGPMSGGPYARLGLRDLENFTINEVIEIQEINSQGEKTGKDISIRIIRNPVPVESLLLTVWEHHRPDGPQGSYTMDSQGHSILPDQRHGLGIMTIANPSIASFQHEIEFTIESVVIGGVEIQSDHVKNYVWFQSQSTSSTNVLEAPRTLPVGTVITLFATSIVDGIQSNTITIIIV